MEIAEIFAAVDGIFFLYFFFQEIIFNQVDLITYFTAPDHHTVVSFFLLLLATSLKWKRWSLRSSALVRNDLI